MSTRILPRDVPRRSQTKGFTSNELLVIAAVLVILAPLLWATLDSDNETVRAAACLANMHQWGLAINLYCEDWNDYFPYEGSSASPIDQGLNLHAWYNVVPPYLGQPTLASLYDSVPPKPPLPSTKSIWSDPGTTNKTVSAASLSPSNPFFMYCFNSRMDPNGPAQFKRSQMTDPSSTIVMCDGEENSYAGTTGNYTPAIHFRGGNFSLGDGHAEWIKFEDFCRSGNPGCPSGAPGGDSSNPMSGDWMPGIKYHWFPYAGAPT